MNVYLASVGCRANRSEVEEQLSTEELLEAQRMSSEIIERIKGKQKAK